MNYGKLSESIAINEAIYRCFEAISVSNQKKFVKKFKEQPHEESQVMDTFRELVLGAFLGSSKFNIEYEREIEEKTPDWCIVDEKSKIKCIIELINYHIDKVTDDEIDAKKKAGNSFIGYRPDQNDPFHNRSYSRIQGKATYYKGLIQNNNLPYVIALFADFKSAVDYEDIKRILFGEDPIFKLYPEVSGVLFFTENLGRYSFFYFANPFATNSLSLPSGIF